MNGFRRQFPPLYPRLLCSTKQQLCIELCPIKSNVAMQRCKGSKQAKNIICAMNISCSRLRFFLLVAFLFASKATSFSLNSSSTNRIATTSFFSCSSCSCNACHTVRSAVIISFFLFLLNLFVDFLERPNNMMPSLHITATNMSSTSVPRSLLNRFTLQGLMTRVAAQRRA